MDLTDKDFKKIKSLHIVSRIPIKIMDKEGRQIKLYHSNIGEGIPYDDIARWNDSSLCLKFNQGIFREQFISLLYHGHTITIGPFLTRQISKKAYEQLLKKNRSSLKSYMSKADCWEYCKSLPVYSLGDVRDFVAILGFLFNVDLEGMYSDALHQKTAENILHVKKEEINRYKYADTEHERYSFYYENKIMELVSKGDLALLKKGIAEIGCSVIPSPTGGSLRSEKNYTIVIVEKLCSLAIEVGKDIIDSIKIRDFYIRKLEQQKELVDVLAVRDSAIIHFTKELHGFSSTPHSPSIRTALQYINLHIYDTIKVTDIARQVFMSESALRHNFKNEMGISITEHITRRKIAEAKLALKAGMTVSETAGRLGFYDTSHFHRTFKSQTGVSPSQFLENTAAILSPGT